MGDRDIEIKVAADTEDETRAALGDAIQALGKLKFLLENRERALAASEQELRAMTRDAGLQ